MENNVKPVAPAMRQAIMRPLAEFINAVEIDKIYHLLNVIDQLMEYLRVNFGQEFITETFDREFKSLQSKKIKDYNSMIRFLSKTRPKINHSHISYKVLKSKKAKNPVEEKKIARIISPYQPELTTIFCILMKVSSIQNVPIDRELLRTPDSSKFKSKSDKLKISKSL